MEQHPRRCIVDTLRDRHQLDSAFSQGAHDVDVVASVPRQTVDFMNDDIIHSVSVLFHIL